jgi:hypothetical protein
LKSGANFMRLQIAAALLLTASAAAAHHGFTGRYDTDRPLLLTGEVIATSTSPPHPTVTLRVDTEAAAPPREPLPAEFTGPATFAHEHAGQTRQVEFPPVGTFFDLGKALKAGDRVQILALRNCNAPHQLRSQWIRNASGAVIQREGRLSYMQRGCASG